MLHDPITPAAETVPHGEFVPVSAMEDILAVRCRQIRDFGHSPEADLAKPLRFFAAELENLARAILEDVQFRKSPELIRRRTVKLGALAMALIDRLDGDPAA